MELKEAILQTLAEIDTNTDSTISPEEKPERDALLDIIATEETKKESPTTPASYERKIQKLDLKNNEELKQLLIKYYSEEEKFLNNLQDRILVLFEGLQSPNNRNIEEKVDMILNFLEFTLAIIDEKKNQK
ncbi:CiaD-like domain-containing protein [Helicobacter canadensis]|uniref:Campylobacter invasion antigen D C-terminal domain-containing protein n=1 Tax=Helicobacter canadensis MIT 98-5491 TaxID=537970 RepID=C5ZYD9_9HELI|nr:hypothetical protein [Helicobacter canadensis]EES90157.1 conserved hypothetical protein [Helicobacter canadensis MIT 98-5491]STP02338.1 Uncharacterised protein [Helicobacter canadensis]